MSENLIYGADILGYGAVADGATDCSDAFLKAIENGENLISVLSQWTTPWLFHA